MILLEGFEEHAAEWARWCERAFYEAVPRHDPLPVWQWAERYFKSVGSPISEEWRLVHGPWWKEPLEWLNDRTIHSITVVGPAQEMGKSDFGEICACYSVATRSGGDVQANWVNDHIAKARWKKRVAKRLLACEPVFRLWPSGLDRNKATAGLVIFPHLNYIMQGVEGKGRLESDTIHVQINEEVHEWGPGYLQLADNRLKRVSFPKQVNISTGGVVADQLHQRHLQGTMQNRVETCPGCKGLFFPFIRTTEGKFGGLRYDASRGRRKDGSYSYEGIEATLYLECNLCGHQMRDDPRERKQRALAAEWGPFMNPEATGRHRSIRMTAAGCYGRPWIDLIKSKHEALRAMRYGDRTVFKNYVQREEADFWDESYRPDSGVLRVTKGLKKREGIPDRDYRLMTGDPQRGVSRDGESSHYWAVIRDWKRMENGQLWSRLVWEGKLSLDEDFDAKRKEYNVSKDNFSSPMVMVDSGDRATTVYKFCARYHYAAIKGESRDDYSHDVFNDDYEVVSKVQRVYGPEQTVEAFFGDHAGGRPIEVPFTRYSKRGLRISMQDVLAAEEIDFEVPDDVSLDYKKHWDAEGVEDVTRPDGSIERVFKQYAPRNDLYVCELYQLLFAHVLGLVGSPERGEK